MKVNPTAKEVCMTPLFILGQIWGLCAMGLIVISFQCKKPARLCVVQVCACLFFILHYLFLGLNGDAAAYAGMTQNAVGLLFRGVLALSEKKKALLSPLVLAGLCAVSAVMAILTYPGRLVALLPTVANFACIGCMWTKNSNTIRVTQLAIISPFWIIYNIFTLSVAGILTECFNLVSIGVYYVRVWREKKRA